ncbi:hypothetical protein M0804_005720 [Polistes exclamans]|nr:hypothetical protein M0804_005720 [Polistes exclamans]
MNYESKQESFEVALTRYYQLRSLDCTYTKFKRLDGLNFIEARARINGTSDIYVKTGSLLTLTCLMSQGPHHLGTVAWYRGNQEVVTSPRSENDINAEPRISVETEWSDALTSR